MTQPASSRYHAAWDNAEPQLRDVCRAAKLWGDVAVEVALAVARQQWIRRGSAGRLNANSSLRMLDAGRIVDVIQQHTGKRRRRRNVNLALAKLVDRGVLAVVADVGRGGVHAVRLAVHFDARCLPSGDHDALGGHNRPAGPWSELGDCLTCPTGLRSADDAGGPLGAGQQWRHLLGLPSEEARRQTFSGVQIPLPLDYPESDPTSTQSDPTSTPEVIPPGAPIVKSDPTSGPSDPTSTFKRSNDRIKRSEERTGGGERSEAETEAAPPSPSTSGKVQIISPDERDRRRAGRKDSSRGGGLEHSRYRHLFRT